VAVLTAVPRRGAQHRAPRRPVHERLADWLDRPHPQFLGFVEHFATSVSVWAFPVSIVVVAVTTKGSV
jgi:hypothetical protein